MIYFVLLLLGVGVVVPGVRAATLSLSLHFTEEELSPAWTSPNLFGLSFHSCEGVMGTAECPGGNAIYNESYYFKTSDKVATNKWVKDYDLGSIYTGVVTFSLFAPLPFAVDATGNLTFSSSITKCVDHLADFEMSQEMCGQIGSSYEFTVSDSLATYSFDIYPSFGLGETGTSSVLLPQFYSSQLNNYRDIPVYVPPSLLQNRVSRPVNIMFVLDGSLSVVESYAKRTGFEAGQLQGQVPESIMIGVSTIEMAYELDFNQRTYELSYEEALVWPTATCISGNTGGSPKMLEWLDQDVIPAVLALLGDTGMKRGEVGMTGGSMGGLTSCYAAAARPDFVQRAICSSPSSCYNYGNGGLSTVITNEYARHGIKPKSVIQFQGQEVYDEDLTSQQGDETIFKNFVNDDIAWRSIGMQSMTSTRTFVPVDVHNPYAYATLDEPPDNVIMSFVVTEGHHMANTWEQEFAASLPHLYRSDRPDKLRKSFLEHVKFITATDPTESNVVYVDGGDDDDSAGRKSLMVIIVAVLSILLAATTIIIGGMLIHITKLQSKLDNKLSDSTAAL